MTPKSFIGESQALPIDIRTGSKRKIPDTRGYFERIFSIDQFGSALSGKSIIQINRSLTYKRGSVRGLHFQLPPFSESKIITCLKGEIFDVVVDLRAGSDTFLKPYYAVLSERNEKVVLVPEGFAHGFQTLTSNSEVLYLHTAPYCKDSESEVNATDPCLKISWPLAITARSQRDLTSPYLPENFSGIKL